MAKVCNIDCDNMKIGRYLMMGNTDLKEWTISGDNLAQLRKVTDCYFMFANCSNLEFFYDDLSSMTDGRGMFNGCSRLSYFDANLSKLE